MKNSSLRKHASESRSSYCIVEAKPNAKAIITSLENIENLLASEEGTIIVAD